MFQLHMEFSYSSVCLLGEFELPPGSFINVDSNSPDYLYRSLDLGEPHLSGSLCCDKLKILS